MLFDFVRLGSPPSRIDRHRLAGTVTIDGLPGKKLIAIIDRTTFALVAAKFSDPATGAWEIAGLPEYPERRLLALALDEEGGTDYNAEAADYLSQVTGA
jgi:hypothetical protein